MSFTREIANYFFSKGPDIGVGARIKNHYVCQREALTGQKCCSMRNSFSVLATAGFQNLKTHLKDCIPNYASLYENREVAGENNDIRNFIRVDKKSQNLYRWIEWIVSSNLPFSFVSNDLTRLDTQNSRETVQQDNDNEIHCDPREEEGKSKGRKDASYLGRWQNQILATRCN